MAQLGRRYVVGMPEALQDELIPLSVAAEIAYFDLNRVIQFVDPESAKRLARHETVVFAELLGPPLDERALEVHVMRPCGGGLYEVERDDTGLVSADRAYALVARIAAAHRCRYATIYPAEERWPPPWASARRD